ncbi:MAG: hypothetical protein HYY96_12760 [Candidatus Tectomicrobia bacterium]|nr:hypothetical protein [Candidatus Tectomicrobia bacterium]
MDTLQALQVLMGSYPSLFDFSAVELDYKDSRRANTLQGVVSYLLDVEQDFPGSSELQRLRAWANWAQPGDSAFTGVRGFGLAGFQYLRLLFGANTAKPDVWICRFVPTASLAPSVQLRRYSFLSVRQSAPIFT